MRLSAPKTGTWWLALIIGVLGIVASLVAIPVLSAYAFWLVVAAFALLLVATFLPGL